MNRTLKVDLQVAEDSAGMHHIYSSFKLKGKKENVLTCHVIKFLRVNERLTIPVIIYGTDHPYFKCALNSMECPISSNSACV